MLQNLQHLCKILSKKMSMAYANYFHCRMQDVITLFIMACPWMDVAISTSDLHSCNAEEKVLLTKTLQLRFPGSLLGKRG